MVKTKFEDLWSEINYTDRYDKERIMLWYLNNGRLKELFVIEVEEKDPDSKSFWINTINDEIGEFERILVPIRNILVITYGNIIILDRRGSYQGNANTELSEVFK